MAKTDYEVLRAHEGDKWYNRGDTRTANSADVKHLVDSGVLVEAKATKASSTKAVESAPKNKSAG